MASHCSEAAVDANSQKSSEACSVVAEWTWLRNRGKVQHLGKIFGLHQRDRVSKKRLVRNRRTDHLDEATFAEKFPPGRSVRRIFKKESREISFRHNGGKIRIRV